MSDELKPPSTVPDAASSSAPSSPSPPVSASPAPVAPSDSGGTAASATPAAQPAAVSPSFSFIQHLAGRGLDVSQFKEDQAAAADYVLSQYQQIAHAHRQLQQQQQLWLAQQQQTQPPQQPEKKGWWNAPEYNPAWAAMVKVDENGQVVPINGGTPDVVAKYHAFRQHQREFFDKFSQNPISAIQPGIEEIAERIAEAKVKQHLSQFGDNQYAAQAVANSPWLYQHDASGNLMRDLMGNPVLSPTGHSYKNYISMLEQAGVTGSKLQHTIATKMAMADALQQKMAQQQAAPPAPTVADQNAQQKAAFLNGAGHIPSHAGSTLPPSNTAATGPAQNSRLPLADRLMQRFEQNGITPSHFER